MSFMTSTEAAESLLGYYRLPGGVTPGGFATLLITCFEKADPMNKARLLVAFPEFTDPLHTLEYFGGEMLSKQVLEGAFK